MRRLKDCALKNWTRGCRIDQNLTLNLIAWPKGMSSHGEYGFISELQQEDHWLKVKNYGLTCCTRQDLASTPTWDPRWWRLFRCNCQVPTTGKGYPISEIARKQKVNKILLLNLQILSRFVWVEKHFWQQYEWWFVQTYMDDELLYVYCDVIWPE